MHEIKLSSKGQIVIPKYMRDSIGIKSGSVVIASLENNKIILMPKSPDPVEAIRKAGEELSLKNIMRDIKEE